jgi:hypothetical protein
MIESYPIDEYHKKPYYEVDFELHIKYVRLAEKDLGVSWSTNNISNRTKKHFGFVAFSKRFPHEKKSKLVRWMCRIEIHNMQKLFAFRLKHGL